MTSAVPDILARIVEHKKAELKQARTPVAELERRAEVATRTRRPFENALRSKHPAIISEIKKASPSKGLLSANFRPVEIALEYESGGAAALSVLTDHRFFQGGLDDLQAARSAVQVPTLRKDFTVSEYHVLEAAAHGADAILLIAAILTSGEMRRYRELASSFNVASLVEVHNAAELDAALDSGAEIIGVNNRNLHTFEVKLETSLELADHIPTNLLKVSESGIETRGQISELQNAGFQAFLIGEHLMRAGSPREALRALIA